MPTRRSSSLGRSVPKTVPRRRSAQLRSHSFAASLPITLETSTGTFVPTTPTSFGSPTSPTFQRGLGSCTSPSFLMSSAAALLDGPWLIIYAQSSCLKRSTWRFSGAERSCYDPVRKARSQVVLASVQPRSKGTDQFASATNHERAIQPRIAWLRSLPVRYVRKRPMPKMRHGAR